jgi:iron complex transport system permease protein
LKKSTAIGLAFAALLVSLLLSVRLGAVPVSFAELAAVLAGRDHSLAFIVMEVRLPRAAVAVLAGAGLAVAGAILQTLVRNPLASPDVIGMTKGAGFAAAAVLYLLPRAPGYALPAAAFAGALAAFVLLSALSRRFTLSPSALALVGVAVGALFQAGIQYLIVRHPGDLNLALLWLSGSLWGRGWNDALSLLPWIAILLPAAWWNFAKLNVIQLGTDTSTSLGLHVPRQRFGLMLLAVALAGSSVAAVGAIGFVGLLAPHIARGLVGSRNQWLLPLAALIGADLMLLGDCVGRIVIVPREVPVGVMTALLGGPYFVWLLKRGRRLSRH